MENRVSFLDKLVLRLFGFPKFEVARRLNVAKGLDLLEGYRRGEPCVALKLSQAGENLYHIMSVSELETLLSVGHKALENAKIAQTRGLENFALLGDPPND